MWHGGGWYAYMRSGDQKPKVTRALLLRVLAYASPYRWHLIGMLVMILITTALSLISPLIFRRLIDVVLPSKNVQQLIRTAWIDQVKDKAGKAVCPDCAAK